MAMSGRKTLAETRKVEELKMQQEAGGVQVVSLTWARLDYLAMAASFSATLSILPLHSGGRVKRTER
jgi:hypothetical protein